MGLGGGPTEWDEYEWVRLPDLRFPTAGTTLEPMARAMADWVQDHRLWADGAGPRILLVDLDNLRADPLHWRARMAFVVALARQSDHPVLAGQGGAVARARPHLAEFADAARPVADGSDVADYELLRAAAAVKTVRAQIAVVSNDGIFADLADRGRLVVISPGRAALSSRLQDAASSVIDLAELERQAQPAARPVAVKRAATRPAPARSSAERQARKRARGRRATARAPRG